MALHWRTIFCQALVSKSVLRQAPDWPRKLLSRGHRLFAEELLKCF